VGKNEKAWHSKGDVRLYFLGQFIEALKKTAVTSKYLMEKGGMKKIGFRKKRRFNGSEDKITKKQLSIGVLTIGAHQREKKGGDDHGY